MENKEEKQIWMNEVLDKLESKGYAKDEFVKQRETFKASLNELNQRKSTYNKDLLNHVGFSFGSYGTVERLFYYYFYEVAYHDSLGNYTKEVMKFFESPEFVTIRDENSTYKNRTSSSVIKNDILKLLFYVHKEYEEHNLKEVRIHIYHNPRISNKELFTNQIGEYLKPPVSDTHSNIYLINVNNGSFEKIRLEIPKTKIDVTKYYNTDFEPIYNKIISKLEKKNEKGLILLHGTMGTGKSTIIKDLISRTENKEFIFVPSNLTDSITSPNFTSFLLQQKNCVLVLEDADSILMKRDATSGTPQSVSNLLNIGDGILGDGLGIQIIATFNIDIKKLDEALMRKGRLTAMYQFSELEVDKCNVIFEELGLDFKTKVPMTLADIFNKEDEIGMFTKEESKKIGFK